MNTPERILMLETQLARLEDRLKEYESDKRWLVRVVGTILIGLVAGLIIKNE
jgi:hypothetical protein